MAKRWGTSIYDIDHFAPLKSDFDSFTKPFTLDPELWEKFSIDDLKNVDFTKWNCVKLMDDGKFSEELSRIPSDTGGIYVYCIEPRIITDAGSYIMYVGKATKSKSENLRRRVKSYTADLEDTRRIRVHNLLVKWGDYIYVHYLPVNSNDDEITALEDRLIAVYGVPYANAEIRTPSIKDAKRIL